MRKGSSGRAGARAAASRRISFIGGLLIVAALATVGFAVWNDRRTTIDAYTLATVNLGTALAEQLSRSVGAVDIVLQATAEKMASTEAATPEALQARLGDADLHDFMVRRTENLPQAESIAVIGTDGTMLNSSLPGRALGMSMADREFYRVLSTRDEPGLFVNPPVRSLHEDKWRFILARRVNGRDGGFRGIAVAIISLDYFSAFYRAIILQKGSAVALLRSDGVFLTRYPPIGTEIGTRLPEGSPWFASVAAHGGTYRALGVVDGSSRLISVHPLRDYPLVVDVSISDAVALAGWRVRVVAIGIGTAGALACLIFLLTLVTAQFRRLEKSEASLAARNQEIERAHAAVEGQAKELRASARALVASEAHLSDKSALLELTLEQMDQGIMMISADQKVEVCNRRAMTMLGLPAELMARRPALTEVVPQLGDEGALAAIDRPAVIERRQPDGRWLEIRSVPLASGGLVRTYTDITDRARADAQIRFAAQHDSLTGLLNRAAFRDRLTQALPQLTPDRSGLAVLFLDLDRFKMVNDTHGHEAGDKLLIQVARRLRAGLRDTDILARLGGDEFAIILTDIDTRQEPTSVSQRLVEAIAAPFDIDGHQVMIGASIGIALAPGDGRDADGLLQSADMALYKAKADGRCCWRFFEPEMNARLKLRRAMELDLSRGIANREFELFYQPIVDVRSRGVTGLEALLRWRHPTRGMLPPDLFIPVAEETGLIGTLGQWALEHACADAVDWPGQPKIAVNLSAVQFASQDLPKEVAAALARTGLAPGRLELEITETVLLRDTAATLETLHRLKALGVRIAMDDFGIGYSSLNYLQRFPFDKVKIDRCFTRELGQSRPSNAIVRAVIDLCDGLDITSTAEGVETEHQFQALRRRGCREAQGFLFSGPRPGEEIPGLLAQHRRLNAVTK